MRKKEGANPNTTKKMDAHYNKIKEERFNDFFMQYLHPLIPNKGKIMDVGCGMGRLLKEIKIYTEARLFGLEMSIVAIRKAWKGAKYMCVDASEWKEKNKYDLIICSQTLEHVDDPVKIISNMKDSLCVGGNLFITVPWPKSSLDRGVKLHYWTFYKSDFENLLPGCKVIKHGINHMIVIW